ncbi:alpha/beta fold hydrolase [Pseudoduganella sp. FT93W]|uniref:Alpha/beta fold hydrolase n=1 Tax=Duganella fentianensis TaxID=2692177 RepID=A0A845HZ13_9BURK|nr:alpha/beta hydrolase [Duganella fentianensis]MYN44721.1 alpha/beta fold hydrolase [Duganella fentianensis]
MPALIEIRNRRFFTALLLTLGLNLTCVGQEREQARAQASPASTADLNARLIQLNSATIEYAEHRAPSAQATIVFENGLLLDFSTWNAVAAGLKQCCNLLFYNRPGVGRSVRGDADLSPESESMRLHQLLKERGFAPPYVLVGHSLGGQYVQAYAKRYPEQVDGLVLVDALPLGVVKPYSEFPWFTRFSLWIFASRAARQEIANIDLMGKYVLEQADFYRKPVIRIVAQSSPQQHKPQGLIKDLLSGVIYAEDFGVWATDPDIAEGRMRSYYPHAQVRSLSAIHRIQEQYPAVVIDAISSLVKKQADVQAALNVVPKDSREE